MMRKSASLKMFACETISWRKPTQPSVLACVGGGFFVVFCFDLGTCPTFAQLYLNHKRKNAPKKPPLRRLASLQAEV